MRKSLLLLAPLAGFSLPAFAADTETADQATLLNSPAAQSETAAPEVAESNRRMSFGLGSGVNSFGGNIGKLYSASSPVAEARFEWALSRLFSVRAGADAASYSFNAVPNGAVDVKSKSLQAAAQWHYLSTGLAAGGFDPYVSGGMAQVFRSQNFLDHNSVEKDNAFALGAGVGTNYLPNNGRVGFWVEADASQVFFQDRYDQQYLPSGVADMTGLLYSARLGMKYVF